jgi:hypothetical protein
LLTDFHVICDDSEHILDFLAKVAKRFVNLRLRIKPVDMFKLVRNDKYQGIKDFVNIIFNIIKDWQVGVRVVAIR